MSEPMKDDHYEFTAVAVLAALALLCVVGIATLIIVRNVTKDNSFGIDSVIELLKTITSVLFGGVITLARATVQNRAPAAPPIAATPQEKVA